MIRVRNLTIISLTALLIYSVAPKHRKKQWRGKIREVRNALVIALVLYWLFMLGALVYRKFLSS